MDIREQVVEQREDTLEMILDDVAELIDVRETHEVAVHIADDPYGYAPMALRLALAELTVTTLKCKSPKACRLVLMNLAAIALETVIAIDEDILADEIENGCENCGSVECAGECYGDEDEEVLDVQAE